VVLDSIYRRGRSPHPLKVKDPNAPGSEADAIATVANIAKYRTLEEL